MSAENLGYATGVILAVMIMAAVVGGLFLGARQVLKRIGFDRATIPAGGFAGGVFVIFVLILRLT